MWAFVATATAAKQQQNDNKQAWVNTATAVAKQQNKDDDPSEIAAATCVVHAFIAAAIVATKEFVEHSSS